MKENLAYGFAISTGLLVVLVATTGLFGDTPSLHSLVIIGAAMVAFAVFYAVVVAVFDLGAKGLVKAIWLSLSAAFGLFAKRSESPGKE